MKKIILGICLFSLGLTSCDQFLNREPYNTIGSDEFFASEQDLEIYSNGLLQYMMPDVSDLTYNGGDCADYLAVSSVQAFLRDGWDYTKQSGWGSSDWKNLHRINYFLTNMHKASSKVSPSVYNHYKGVGHFWRAWFYFDKVKTFGDVPWYNKPIDTADSISLYKARDSRECVMDSILQDLNYAVNNCSTNSEFTNTTLINKYVALALKARICLFEGTYRKYHTTNPSTGKEWEDRGAGERFLREAVSACEELMNGAKFGLISNPSDVKTQYRNLFTQEKVNYKEVIFAREYQADVAMHDATLRYNSAGNNTNRWSPTKEFINTYLCLDGSRFTDKSSYDTIQTINEFKSRDYRLMQTIIVPGFTKKVGGVSTLWKPNWNITYTGYQIIKYNIDDDKYESTGNSYNSIPVFRYAEILLNYAEAKYELGEFNETIWNKTIKLLRERAGVTGTAPTTADPYLAAYYNNKVTDKWLLEIRRERAIELFMEGSLRYDDLMRWAQGDLLTKSWSSIYIPQKNVGYDINGDGKADLMVVDKLPSSTDKNIYYVNLSKAPYFSYVNGQLQKSNETVWTESRYLHPIPQTAIVKNPNLTQNQGW